MDWFLYDNSLRHESVKDRSDTTLRKYSFQSKFSLALHYIIILVLHHYHFIYLVFL